MKRVHQLYIYGGLTCLLTALAVDVQAQTQVNDTTLSRTVVVEQEYNPDIVDAAKVNVLPKMPVPTVSKKSVEYDRTLAPTGHIPATSLQAYTGQEVPDKAYPGYVRLGLGNYGNTDFLANYLLLPSAKDKLDFHVALDGMNGKLKAPEPEGEEKWKSRYYRTRAGVDYTHNFSKVDLNIAGNFALSNFNFLPTAPDSKQKFTTGGLHVGLRSTNQEQTIRFWAETNLMLYQRQHDYDMEDAAQNLIRTRAAVTGTITEKQFITVGVEMDNVFYKNTLFEDYTSLCLNPYYSYLDENWKLHLGAHVDLALGFGKKVQAAPDVEAQYTFAKSYILYAQAKGGRLQNDFARLEQLCPYGQLVSQLDATYEQLNAAVGFKASPVDGLWFNIYGGYQSLKNDVNVVPLTILSDNETTTTYPLAWLQGNTWNTYAGAAIEYGYKDLFKLAVEGTYRSWDADEGHLNTMLDYKPQLEARMQLECRPVSDVTFHVGYRHVTYEETPAVPAPEAVGNLYLGGSYRFLKGITLYANVNNLLNKDYRYYWSYPTEGFNFIGGVSFQF